TFWDPKSGRAGKWARSSTRLHPTALCHRRTCLGYRLLSGTAVDVSRTSPEFLLSQ
ncbi:hypothetical protein NDU88_000454, partial [Pleurodeles waltl]